MSEIDVSADLTDDESKETVSVSNYRKLLWSSAAGNLADGMFKLTIPLAAATLTGNPILVASVSAALSLPWLLASLHAGVFADRLDRLKIMVRSNAVRAVLLLLLTIGYVLDVETIWLLCFGAFGLGLAEVMFDTSAQAILPSLVGRDRIARANARLMTIEFAMNQFVGKVIGGWLVGIAIAWAFGAAALAYILGSIALIFVIGEFKANRGEKTSIRADISEGLHFLWKAKALRDLALLIAVLEIAYEGLFALLPLYALAERSGPLGLTPAGYGLLVSIGAVGGLVGTLVVDRIDAKFHPVKAMAIAIIGAPVFAATIAFSENVYLVAIGSAMFGATSMIFTVLSVTMRQRLIPDELLGRVNAAYRLPVFGAMAVGPIVAGLIVRATSFHVFAVTAFIIGLVVVPCVTLMTKPYDQAIGAVEQHDGTDRKDGETSDK